MPQDKVDIAKRAVDAFNRRDTDGMFAELLTPDIEHWPAVAGAYEGGCYQGREGIERFAAAVSEVWEEVQLIAEEFRDLGDRVLVLGQQVGRGRGSGAQVDAPLAAIFDFRGDRIWRSRGYVDRAEGLRVAGVSE
jgi:ketosteroid isomerase-like protein